MHNVDLSALYAWLNPIIQQLLEGLALFISAWLAYLLKKYAPPIINAKLETKASNDINTALANGVAIAMHTVVGAENVHQDVAVKSQVAAWAAQYAADHAPQAAARFGLDLEALSVKALAYLPAPPTTEDTTGVTIQATKIDTVTLPPAEAK